MAADACFLRRHTWQQGVAALSQTELSQNEDEANMNETNL